ncbi:MAG: hypothetical protein WA888_12605 [Burkholderiaceae bacterium]
MSKPKITFLHTAKIHEASFDKLLLKEKANFIVEHVVRDDWLAIARADGLTDELIDQVSVFLRAAAKESSIVICTCSTLGPIAQSVNLDNVIRVDKPMMDKAATIEGTALLAMCLDSTVDASINLLETAYLEQDRTPDYEVVSCAAAWPLFEQNKSAEFAREIAYLVRVETALIPNLGCVILAQASMAVAARELADLSVPVLTSPELAVKAALARAGASPVAET